METISQGLLAKLGLDMSEFRTKLAKAVGLSERASKAISAGFARIGRIVRRAALAVAALGAAGAALTVGFTRSVIKAADTSEKFRLRLNALLGSVEEGAKTFELMNKFAKDSVFEFEEIMAAATQLSGIVKGGADEIASLMPIIADLAAVSGLSIDQTTEQIVRAFSAGIGSADLFRERGIVAMLGFEAGATISAANTRRKIIAEWEKTGSKFRGTAEDLAKTWTGITGMLADRWFIFKNLVADAGLFDIVKRAADGLVRKLNELADTGKLNEFAQATSDTIVKIVNSTVRGVAFVAGQLIDIVEFFRSIPIATGFGLVGLVFFGPTGGAVLAALGLGIDKLAEKLFGATTVSGRFAENIAEAQAEAGRLAQTLASGGGDPAAIHKRMQELNVIIDINTRLLTRMDEEAGITFGSLREMLAGFEDFSIESLFGSDPVTVTAELNELLLVTHDSLRVAITASAEFTANLKRASEEATEAAKKFLDWQKQMDRMGETIQNQLIGGIGEVLLQLDDVLGTIKSIGRAILREIIANLARAAAAGESLGSVLKGAGSFGLIGAGNASDRRGGAKPRHGRATRRTCGCGPAESRGVRTGWRRTLRLRPVAPTGRHQPASRCPRRRLGRVPVR